MGLRDAKDWRALLGMLKARLGFAKIVTENEQDAGCAGDVRRKAKLFATRAPLDARLLAGVCGSWGIVMTINGLNFMFGPAFREVKAWEWVLFGLAHPPTPFWSALAIFGRGIFSCAVGYGLYKGRAFGWWLLLLGIADRFGEGFALKPTHPYLAQGGFQIATVLTLWSLWRMPVYRPLAPLSRLFRRLPPRVHHGLPAVPDQTDLSRESRPTGALVRNDGHGDAETAPSEKGARHRRGIPVDARVLGLVWAAWGLLWFVGNAAEVLAHGGCHAKEWERACFGLVDPGTPFWAGVARVGYGALGFAAGYGLFKGRTFGWWLHVLAIADKFGLALVLRATYPDEARGTFVLPIALALWSLWRARIYDPMSPFKRSLVFLSGRDRPL